MNPHIASLVEAVRLARLELECHQDPDCRASDRWTLERLKQLLGSEEVRSAMAALAPDEADISLVPDSPPPYRRVPEDDPA